MQNCDIAIFFALTEEFDEFLPEIAGINRSEQDEKTGRAFFLFDWPAENAAPYKCVAGFVGSMGAQDAGQFTNMILTRYSPKTFAVLGIAGSLSGEVLVGDVVVADQVDDYLQDGRVEEDGLAPSRRSYRPHTRLNNFIRYLPFTDKNSWDDIVRENAADLHKLTDGRDLGKAAGAVLGQGAAHPHIGHLASGPLVGASQSYKAWLTALDRKYLALDMETAGVMNAIYNNAGDERVLIIRGISDMSDGRKAHLDRIGDRIGRGVFRGFAMRNSIRLLLALIRKGLFERGETKRDDSDPHAVRVFLSSSLLHRKEIHRAVEEVVEAMGHTCIDSRYYGHYPRTLFKSMSDALRSADILIVVVGRSGQNEDGHSFDDGTNPENLKREYEEAEAHCVRILSYRETEGSNALGLKSRVKDVLSPQRRELRNRINKLSTPFSTVEDLKEKLKSDLERFAGIGLSGRLMQDASRELSARHIEVLAALDKQDYDEALALNRKIIEEYPSSMRARYNDACIRSQLAGLTTNKNARRLQLMTARHSLADAVDYGILQYIRLSKGCLDRASAVDRVVQDVDLMLLFQEFPELKSMLAEGKTLRFATTSSGRSGGCACGCDGAVLPSGTALTPLQEQWLRIVGR